jgi:3-oxoacyl-[acyl-carrier-protein] synthase II
MGYINGIGVVSSQDLSKGIPEMITEYRSDYLKCLDPDYKQFINPIAARRMSRLIKTGITAARLALAEAGTDMPGAIITGTGLGSVEDTEKLLSELHSGATILNPTPFIQSTYNTISSQIAINLKCHNYNSTYVHRAVSFESAMQDGLMQLDEGVAQHFLAGGIDEMTLTHLGIIRRQVHWKRSSASNLDLLNYGTPGALAGEGAAFFVVGTDAGVNAYCRLDSLDFLYPAAGPEKLTAEVTEVFNRRGRSFDEIDLLVMGYNGDKDFDGIYDQVSTELFPGKPVAWFKHISGEYYTASAIGLWMAANILKSQQVPSSVLIRGTAPQVIKRVLFYNQYRNDYHTLALVSSL